MWKAQPTSRGAAASGTGRTGPAPTQAAYAAPLILLAQTRQADRDKFAAQEAQMRHRELEQHQEREAARTLELLEANTALTRQTEALAEQIARLGGSVLPLSGSGPDATPRGG